MRSILIQANAKINLELEILSKRTDGYHEIRSIIQSIDLSDFLLLEKPSIRVRLGAGPAPHRPAFSEKSGAGTGSKKDYLTGAIICPETENIILKTKQALEKTLNKKLPCQIHLQKSIPIAAGLGGGSADAAAVLFGLNLLYNLNLSKKELAAIGARVGADLPFFFYGGVCKIKGMGERVIPLKKRVSKFFLLFRPHKRLETKMMYELHDKTKKDFFALSKEICPVIKELEKYLQNFPIREFGLSGSGPTIFCGVNSYKLAKNIIEGYLGFNGDIFICHPQAQALKVIESL